MSKYVFGPVPSRRLGRSLGVNNIPLKHCSYSCVYCQLGRTFFLEAERRSFYPINDVVSEVVEAIGKLGESKVNYVTFVPDGEPTLDANLGKIAERIKLNISTPIAILSNASLIHMEDVRQDLSIFNLVSLKIDAVMEETWRGINRPHPKLCIHEILGGIMEFSKKYRGKLVFETMLVRGLNDGEESFKEIAEFLSKTRFHKTYISIPTRPPAENWVKPPTEEILIKAYSIFSEKLGADKVELLIGYEGPEFTSIGDPIESLLAIIAVHPMRIDYAYSYLLEHGVDPEKTISNLVKEGRIVKISYRNHTFIVRRIPLEK